MSGLEVIGIILGAVPLVISALEHYAEGVKTIRVIRHFAQEFRAVARKLEAEHLLFRNTLAILLNECIDIGGTPGEIHDAAACESVASYM